MRKSLKVVFIGIIISCGINMVGCESTEDDYTQDINDMYTDAYIDEEIENNTPDINKEESSESKKLTEKQALEISNYAYELALESVQGYDRGELEKIIRVIEESLIGIDLTEDQLNKFIESVILGVYDGGVYLIDKNGKDLTSEEAIFITINRFNK